MVNRTSPVQIEFRSSLRDILRIRVAEDARSQAASSLPMLKSRRGSTRNDAGDVNDRWSRTSDFEDVVSERERRSWDCGDCGIQDEIDGGRTCSLIICRRT